MHTHIKNEIFVIGGIHSKNPSRLFTKIDRKIRKKSKVIKTHKFNYKRNDLTESLRVAR